MRIVADENMPLLDEFFGSLGEIRRVPGRRMVPADVEDADLLLVRSVTRVDAELLARAAPRFVGTATIGTDHVDVGLLAGRGIPFAAAPGCNAVAVADYVTTVLALFLAEAGQDAPGFRLAVVGCGQVGRRVADRALALGFELAVVDPLLGEADSPAGAARMAIDEALAWADIVTLHVPLTVGGAAPTRHLLDARRLASPRWRLLLNTSRGAVVDNAALSQELAARPGRRVVLDVWEGEPAIDPVLAGRVWLGTPHVAGYSQEGKWRGTWMLRVAAGRALGLEPGPALDEVTAALGDRPEALPWQGGLADTLLACCPLRRDHAALLASLREPYPAEAFDRLRKDYPVRREFSHYAITKTPRAARGLLSALGFAVPVD